MLFNFSFMSLMIPICTPIDGTNVFTDSKEAMQSYAKLHHQNPGREFYVLHTDREKLDIAERKWIGIRGAQ